MNVVQSKQSYLHIPIEQKWVVDFEGSQKTREYLILTLTDLRFNIASATLCSGTGLSSAEGGGVT